MSLATILLQEMPVISEIDGAAEDAGKQAIEQIESVASLDALDNIIDSLIHFGFKLAIAIVIFILGRFIIQRLHKWVKKIMMHRGADPSLTTFILSLIKITLYFVLIIIVIGTVGVETSSFLALFASAGVAVGLALSGTLQNFAGGVLILLLKPYKVGDFIEAQGFTGTVKEIQIFNTIINTPDNKAIIIPNGGLSTSSINNYSMEKRRRLDWTIGVAYGTDIDVARSTILELLATDSRVENTPAPSVYVSELADSAVNLSVRAWVANEHYWDVFFKYNELFYKLLPDNGIEFPFPQLDVHIQNNQA